MAESKAMFKSTGDMSKGPRGQPNGRPLAVRGQFDDQNNGSNNYNPLNNMGDYEFI